MKQYINLLKEIQAKGTDKPAARAGMPGSKSLFGFQFRHNLADGFPLLTTKKVSFKNIVIELLWFLRGDTNIKFLVDQGCNIWNQDAYNYYCKNCNNVKDFKGQSIHIDFDSFVEIIKTSDKNDDVFVPNKNGYKLGDCGYQYGKVWRDWAGFDKGNFLNTDVEMLDKELQGRGMFYHEDSIDQIKNLIHGLKKTPEGRRHIVTAIDPAHDTELALYWCHCLMQFNCRSMTWGERYRFLDPNWDSDQMDKDYEYSEELMQHWDEIGKPKYLLDCQLYQRSADTVLGVPYNIASYALLTHILAKVCNMAPGEVIFSYGDAHIYDNHKEAVELQLTREPGKLPTLNIDSAFDTHILQWAEGDVWNTNEMISSLDTAWFKVDNYNPQPAIKAELSTGLIFPEDRKTSGMDTV